MIKFRMLCFSALRGMGEGGEGGKGGKGGGGGAGGTAYCLPVFMCYAVRKGPVVNSPRYHYYKGSTFLSKL